MQNIGYAARVDGEWVRRSYAQRKKELGVTARKTPTPDIMASLGLVDLFEADPPEITGTQVLERAPIALIDGQVVRGWTVRDMTPDELAAAKAQKTALIKSEAARRIVAVVPEWKQRNLIAQATQLLAKGRSNWSDAEKAAWAAGDAVWRRVAAIRARSDEIEAMDPLPADVTNDDLWP